MYWMINKKSKLWLENKIKATLKPLHYAAYTTSNDFVESIYT